MQNIGIKRGGQQLIPSSVETVVGQNFQHFLLFTFLFFCISNAHCNVGEQFFTFLAIQFLLIHVMYLHTQSSKYYSKNKTPANITTNTVCRFLTIIPNQTIYGSTIFLPPFFVQRVFHTGHQIKKPFQFHSLVYIF